VAYNVAFKVDTHISEILTFVRYFSLKNNFFRKVAHIKFKYFVFAILKTGLEQNSKIHNLWLSTCDALMMNLNKIRNIADRLPFIALLYLKQNPTMNVTLKNIISYKSSISTMNFDTKNSLKNLIYRIEVVDVHGLVTDFHSSSLAITFLNLERANENQ
jgi:hypothetical protein